MKKNIFIVLLLVVTVLSSVYAFIQQTAAVAAQRQAEMNLVISEANAQSLREALRQSQFAKQEAEINFMEAMKQRKLYEDLLKKNKK